MWSKDAEGACKDSVLQFRKCDETMLSYALQLAGGVRKPAGRPHARPTSGVEGLLVLGQGAQEGTASSTAAQAPRGAGQGHKKQPRPRFNFYDDGAGTWVSFSSPSLP